MPKITYTELNQNVDFPKAPANLLDVSIKNKIPHIHECGGTGKCTTCRVRITKGQQNVSKPTPLEKRLARKRHWDPSIRLACQCFVHGDIEIQRLLWNAAEVNQLQLETLPQGEAKEQSIAILICDLRDFTRITSRNLNFDMAHMLNRFYTVIGDPILKNNGIIYQYVGDEIIGIFGVSGGTQNQNCKDALRAAMGMQYAIERLNYAELKNFDATFKIGIGIHYGEVYIGYLGHPNHRQLGIVGDPINVTSRIQGMTKETKSKILISHSVYSAFDRNYIQIGNWHKKQLKGKEKPIFLYEFQGFAERDIHIELQNSLNLLLQKEGQLAIRFYEKLFLKAPQVKSLFKDDILAQAKILNHMLVGIVYGMSRPEDLKSGLSQLGKRHKGYGVQPEHYPIVLEVLVETIREVLGEDFTDWTEEAWRTAITLITELMNS